MSHRTALPTLLALGFTLCAATASHAQRQPHNSLSDSILAAASEERMQAQQEFNQERDLTRYIAVGSFFLFGGFFIWLRSR